MVFQASSFLCFPVACCKIVKIKGHLSQKPPHSKIIGWMKPHLLFGSMAVQNETFYKRGTMSRTGFYWLPYGLQVNTLYYNYFFYLVFRVVLKIIWEGSWAWYAEIRAFFVLSLPLQESRGRLGKWCRYGCRNGTQHPLAEKCPQGPVCAAPPGAGDHSRGRCLSQHRRMCFWFLKKKKTNKKNRHQNSCNLDSWSGSW